MTAEPAGPMDAGIPIRAQEFSTLVRHYLVRMESGDELTAEDYVTMVRLWNTIELHRLDRGDELFRDYSAAFFPQYVERISKCLNARPTKGMALYSEDHDLFIGGPPHAHSQYALEGRSED